MLKSNTENAMQRNENNVKDNIHNFIKNNTLIKGNNYILEKTPVAELTKNSLHFVFCLVHYASDLFIHDSLQHYLSTYAQASEVSLISKFIPRILY